MYGYYLRPPRKPRRVARERVEREERNRWLANWWASRKSETARVHGAHGNGLTSEASSVRVTLLREDKLCAVNREATLPVAKPNPTFVLLRQPDITNYAHDELLVS